MERGTKGIQADVDFQHHFPRPLAHLMYTSNPPLHPLFYLQAPALTHADQKMIANKNHCMT